MKRIEVFTYEFVDTIPKELIDGKLYISISYSTVVHNCACGCGKEVVTPLSPTDWKLIYDGESVSIDPSIGNWSFPCRSHYWIKNNKVRWSYMWLKEEIKIERKRDLLAKNTFYNSGSLPVDPGVKQFVYSPAQFVKVLKKILRFFIPGL